MFCRVVDTKSQTHTTVTFPGYISQGHERLLGMQNSVTHAELYGDVEQNAAVEIVHLPYEGQNIGKELFEKYIGSIPLWRCKTESGAVTQPFYPITESKPLEMIVPRTYYGAWRWWWDMAYLRYEIVYSDVVDGKRHWRIAVTVKWSTPQTQPVTDPEWTRTHLATYDWYEEGSTVPIRRIDSQAWLHDLRAKLDNPRFWQDMMWRMSHYPVFPDTALVANVLKDLKTLDINTITAVQGLATLARDIRELVAAAEGHVNVKWLVSTYLYMKYGFENSTRDVIDLTEFYLREINALYAKKSAWQTSHASDGVQFMPRDGSMLLSFKEGYETTTLTVYVKTLDEGLAKVTRSMMDLDVFPELGNIWDIIPFSFVVDWFVPVQEFLDAVDANTYRATLKVGACLSSYSYTFKGLDVARLLPGMDENAIGHVDARYYVRTVQSFIPDPAPELRSPTTFNQWLPAGALIAQGAMNRHKNSTP
jgi:hypothetical protein